ncbi:MAG TPA: signal peptidase I [Myxococcota bacterium]|nr:signal peptidase I [Myxococcota bacterium]
MKVLTGNAVDAARHTRGWLLGHFMPDGPLQTPDVEVKWHVHAAGETRPEWAPALPVRTLNVLVRGSVVLMFPGREVPLAHEGDFVLFGPDVPHSFRAVDESLVLTVRWPSLRT